VHDDYPRPKGAVPLQRLVEFPVQVPGETAYRYEKVAQRRMREFVDHWLAGVQYETNGDAFMVIAPHAEACAGRGLSVCEIALLAWAIRDYRNAQEVSRRHRPGSLFR
jgi:hypothetical protein